MGLKIRAVRESVELSQRQFAALLHLSHSSISYIESGNQRIYAGTLAEMAAVLMVDVSELYPD